MDAAGVAGVLLAGYSNKAYQCMGDAYLLPSIAAVVIGGTNRLSGPGRYSIDALFGWDTVSAVIFVPLAALAVIIDALAIRAAPAPVAPRREEPAPEQKRRAA